jgi:hypothetical protein
MDCAIGKSGSVELWTFNDEAPEDERICVGVTAKE